MEPCPWCGAKAVDVTTIDEDHDRRRKFICCGLECHEWRDGEGPEPPQESLIILATH